MGRARGEDGRGQPASHATGRSTRRTTTPRTTKNALGRLREAGPGSPRRQRPSELDRSSARSTALAADSSRGEGPRRPSAHGERVSAFFISTPQLLNFSTYINT